MPLLLALMLAQAQAPASPAKDVTLAIASVDARGGATAEQAAEMNEALTAQLVSDGRMRIVERQQIAKVMKEQALSQSGLMSDEAQVKLAQLLGARFLAVAALQGSGRSLLLSLRAMDSSTAQIAFAETLKVGSGEQIEAGSRQLARKMEEKLLGKAAPGAASNEVVGDFDVGEVKDAAKGLARSLGMRFPRIVGRVVDALPNGTLSCSFGNAQPFSGQFFEVTGRDEVTEQEVMKGYFLLGAVSRTGCSGKVKTERGQNINAGDSLNSVALKINLESLEPGAGAQPELARLLADETRSALDAQPQFQVANDPQLTVIGRVSGPRGNRSVELQVVDKKGNVVQKVDLPGAF